MNYIPYENVAITIVVIGAALAFIVLVWNAVKAIAEWRRMLKKPSDDKLNNLEDRVTHLEEWVERADEKLDYDYKFLEDEVEFNQLMLKSIKQLLQHEIDDNDKQGLIDMEREIDSFLVSRAHKH